MKPIILTDKPLTVDRPFIFIDLDGTCARFRLMHEEYKIENTVKFFHPEDLYEKGYFLALEPVIQMVNTAKKLMEDDFNVSILSSCLFDSKYAKNEKIAWVHKYISEDIPIILTPCGTKKSDFIQSDGSIQILIDDYSKNLFEWEEKPNFKGIKVRTPINGTRGTWQKASITLDLPYKEIKGLITDLIIRGTYEQNR